MFTQLSNGINSIIYYAVAYGMTSNEIIELFQIDTLDYNGYIHQLYTSKSKLIEVDL